MAVFVKICGVCSGLDAKQIYNLRPDAMGFVFWSGSARCVSPTAVAEWETPALKRVGVFVDPSEDELLETVRQARLDVVQIHSKSLDWELDFRRLKDLEIWLASTPERIANLSSFPRRHARRILLDNSDPRTVGGTGEVCDWTAARQLVELEDLPILLAGGLNCQNLASALRAVSPWGVDVSSGVEDSPGKKDLSKVERFISICRSNKTVGRG